MKERNWKTSLLTMLSAVMLAGIIISVPDPKPDEPASPPEQSSGGAGFGDESGINPLSDLYKEKLD